MDKLVSNPSIWRGSPCLADQKGYQIQQEATKDALSERRLQNRSGAYEKGLTPR